MPSPPPRSAHARGGRRLFRDRGSRVQRLGVLGRGGWRGALDLGHRRLRVDLGGIDQGHGGQPGISRRILRGRGLGSGSLSSGSLSSGSLSSGSLSSGSLSSGSLSSGSLSSGLALGAGRGGRGRLGDGHRGFSGRRTLHGNGGLLAGACQSEVRAGVRPHVRAVRHGDRLGDGGVRSDGLLRRALRGVLRWGRAQIHHACRHYEWRQQKYAGAHPKLGPDVTALAPGRAFTNHCDPTH